MRFSAIRHTSRHLSRVELSPSYRRRSSCGNGQMSLDPVPGGCPVACGATILACRSEGSGFGLSASRRRRLGR